MAKQKVKLLFLCTGNSCRSQMAEGWLRHLRDDDFEVFSAGIETHGLNPLAVKVMWEAGVDISMQQSQLLGRVLEDLPVDQLDYVLTVCGHADQHCPELPHNVACMHLGFDDPPKLAANAQNDEDALPFYRQVRDEIKKQLENIDQLLVGI